MVLAQTGKRLSTMGDLGSTTGQFSGEGTRNPLQYSAQGNPMDGGA